MDSERDFLKSVVIETLIPEDSQSLLPELLQDDISQDTGASTRLLQTKQRDLLFFDEKVRVLAILQVPRCDEETIKSLLSRIEFRIDAWAIDRLQQNLSSAGAADITRDLIHSANIVDFEDPIMLARQTLEGDTVQEFLALVWETHLVLTRPRIRVPEPAIYLHSTVLVSAPEVDGGHSTGAYLAPFETGELNILEPLQHLRGFDGDPPYLAASRVERVLPETRVPQKKFRIEHISVKKRIVPAAIARVRYVKPNLPSPLPSTIAALDVEIVPFVEICGTIERADVSMTSVRVENLMPGFLPMTCGSRDSFTFLYKLNAHVQSFSTAAGPMADFDVLSIKLDIKIKVSENCEPLISMELATNVDIIQPPNPTFPLINQSSQRVGRPSSLTLGHNDPPNPPAMQSSLQHLSGSASTPGVTITFTAPKKPAKVSVPFIWQVLVVNLSNRSIKLAIIPIPRIQRAAAALGGGGGGPHLAKKHAPKSSTASFHPSERRHTKHGADEDVDMAQAVVDENVVYAMQHSHAVPAETDLMALTAELRIGPLGPGQCHEGEIQWIAFEAGAMRVDAIRVVDLVKEAEDGPGAPGVITDIRDLPDVLVAVESSSKME